MDVIEWLAIVFVGILVGSAHGLMFLILSAPLIEGSPFWVVCTVASTGFLIAVVIFVVVVDVYRKAPK